MVFESTIIGTCIHFLNLFFIFKFTTQKNCWGSLSLELVCRPRSHINVKWVLPNLRSYWTFDKSYINKFFEIRRLFQVSLSNHLGFYRVTYAWISFRFTKIEYIFVHTWLQKKHFYRPSKPLCVGMGFVFWIKKIISNFLFVTQIMYNCTEKGSVCNF